MLLHLNLLLLLGPLLTLAQTLGTTPILNFTQLLNHDSNDSTTFQQAYQVNATYFKPGGPILFYQAAESDGTLADQHGTNGDNLVDYAEELGAMVVALEHRFFGTSFPEGFRGTKEDFKPLTIDSLVQDAVRLVEYIKKTVPGAGESKVIVNGGSYGGTLVTLFKKRAPDTFFGAIASSPAYHSWGPSKDNKAKFNYANSLSNVYYDTSFPASTKIQTALSAFDSCSQNGTCATAIPTLNLCGPQPNTTAFRKLYEGTVWQYRLIAQYSAGVPFSVPTPFPLDVLINRTLTANTTGDILRVPIDIALNSTLEERGKCINWTDPTLDPASVTDALGNTFYYIMCSFFPTQELNYPPGGIIPASQGWGEPCLKPEYLVPEIYNHTNEWFVNTLYGFDDASLDAMERLLIVHGSLDPTMGNGMPKLTLSSERTHVRVIVGQGNAHTEDMLPEWVLPRGVKPNVDAIRDIKLQYIKEWLLVNATSSSSANVTTPGLNLTENRASRPHAHNGTSSASQMAWSAAWIPLALFASVAVF